MQESLLVNKIKKIEEKYGIRCAVAIPGFSYRGQELFPTTSLIKIPLALGVFSVLPMEKELAIRKEDFFPGAGVIRKLALKKLSVFELLAVLLAQSDNSAQNVLLRAWGQENFKKYLLSLGLKKTKFHPLSLRSKKTSLTCADDFFSLGAVLEKNKILLQLLSRAPVNFSASFLPARKKYFHKIGRRPEATGDFFLIKEKKEIFCLVSLIKNWPKDTSNQYKEKVSLLLHKLIYKYLCQDLSIPKKSVAVCSK